MSTSQSWFRRGSRGRTSAVALASAAALAATVLGAVPAATAAGGSGGLAPADVGRPRMDAGRYIVVMKDAPAASYSGGVRGYAATRVPEGRQLDARSSLVARYTGHLRAEQQRAARSVGALVARHYTTATNGFAAELTARQATELAADKDVLTLVKDEARRLDTWDTPRFLGLSGSTGVWQTEAGGRRQAGQGTVVGVIDSGIWPEARSFRGAALTSRPATRWNISRTRETVFMDKADGGRFIGACELEHDGVRAEGWSADDCTTKLIGARFYPDTYLAEVDPADVPRSEFLSTRDGDGHGTHTASTAAGNPVRHASVEGVDFGEISGMAPGARIAAYKVCFDDGDEETGDCFTSAILAAVDDAVKDGVDTLNFSISGPQDTVIDPVELAFEGAAEAGIFVATSAGNAGPGRSTVAHNSPWLTTVAAATHHNFENTVVLGDRTAIRGASISQQALPQTPLVAARSAAAVGADLARATLCDTRTLAPVKATGRIVICERGGGIDRVAKSAEVKRAGGVGMILLNATAGESLDADFHSVPTIHVPRGARKPLEDYLAADPTPTAGFRLGDTTGRAPTPLPQIAGFSSRGPALANDSDLLKPDLAAPGVSVLAAVAPPSGEGRRFDLYSGTSMASPHVAGLANLILGEHPFWSPMRVKSALMTTATPLRDGKGRRSRDVFAAGAGHVNPRRMFDPGLFVLSHPQQWRRFAEAQYRKEGGSFGLRPLAAKRLNSPSMADGSVVASTSFTRTFKADRRGTWKISFSVPGFSVKAPARLDMRRGESSAVRMTFTRTTARLGSWTKGYMWLTGPTRVRLPIALRPLLVAAPREVRGSGLTGSRDVTVTSGATQNLRVVPHGLDESRWEERSVVEGAEDAFCERFVGTDSLVARFDLDAADDDADLDLYVYKVDGCTAPLTASAEFVGATTSADEQVTIPRPQAGFYAVFVDGYAAAPGQTSTDYRLDVYDVTAGAGAGNLAVSPDPVPLVARQRSTFTASWSGLTAGSRYLGVLDYPGAGTSTYLRVDAPATTPAPAPAP